MVRLTDGSGQAPSTHCADCGVFNDLAAGRHLELSDSARDDMNTPVWADTVRCGSRVK